MQHRSMRCDHGEFTADIHPTSQDSTQLSVKKAVKDADKWFGIEEDPIGLWSFGAVAKFSDVPSLILNEWHDF